MGITFLASSLRQLGLVNSLRNARIELVCAITIYVKREQDAHPEVNLEERPAGPQALVRD
jgi:hypothetical protein